MKYYDFLENNRTDIVEKLEILLTSYKVEPVGNGYIDCIIMKDKLNDFIKEVSELEILITDVNWWCYVNPNEAESTGCPHGMGGPHSQYYEGWFSELKSYL